MKKSIVILMLVTIGCTPTAGDAPRQGRHAARIAAAVPAGDPVSCVQINRIRNTRVLDNSTIDFELNDGSTLRNILPNSCPGLGAEEAFSYATSLSQLCSVDIISVLYQGGGIRQGASCGLGKFQPVTFPGK